jgi:hypothetical protein
MWSGRGTFLLADAGGDADGDADRDVDDAADGTVDAGAGFVRAGWQPTRLSETTMARVRIRARCTASMIAKVRLNRCA